MAAIPERAMIKVVMKARGSTVMFFQTRLALVLIQSTRAMMAGGFESKFDLVKKSPPLISTPGFTVNVSPICCYQTLVCPPSTILTDLL